MNNESEMISRNIELSAEFSRYLFEHSEIEEKLPMGAEIIFLPEFDKELKEFNLSLGKQMEADGENVTYVSIKDLGPKNLSRIKNAELAKV